MTKLNFHNDNILNVFTVTFDQFNATLLNKSINFFKNIFTDPKLLNGSQELSHTTPAIMKCIIYVYIYIYIYFYSSHSHASTLG